MSFKPVRQPVLSIFFATWLSGVLDAWRPQLAYLAIAGYRVWAPDQRGYKGRACLEGVSTRLQDLWLQYANEGQIPVALLMIQPIAHHKLVRDIKTSEGHRQVDNPPD